MGFAKTPDIVAYHEGDRALKSGCPIFESSSHEEPFPSGEVADGLPKTTVRADTTPEMLEQTDACSDILWACVSPDCGRQVVYQTSSGAFRACLNLVHKARRAPETMCPSCMAIPCACCQSWAELQARRRTRPAQKMSRSAKNWVPRSPMASLERTTLAPESAHFCSLS